MTRPARVIPWERMTIQQSREHMSLMHGIYYDTHETPSLWLHKHYHLLSATPHTHDKETP